MKHLALIGLLVFVYFTAYYMFAAVVKSMWRDGVIPGAEHEYEAIAGLWLITIPAIVASILTIPIGVLADKLGRVKILAVTGVVMSIGLIVVGLAPNLYVLSAGFVLFAVGLQGISPVVVSVIADTTPQERRGLGYAIYLACTVMGFPLGLIVGLLLAWRTGYSSLGALVLVLIVVVFAVLEKMYKYVVPRKVVEEAYKARVALEAITSPAILVLIVLVFFYGIPWGAITRYAVNFLMDVWGVTQEIATVILALGSISTIIGHILGGLLADRRVKIGDILGRVKVSILGLAVGTLVLLTFVNYPYPYGRVELAVLLPPAILVLAGMMFTTFTYPNINAVISEVTLPKYRSTVFAVFNIVGSLGWGVGPTLYGLLKDYYYRTVAYGLAMEGAIALASRYSTTTIVLLWLVTLVAWIIMFKLYPKSRVAEV